MQTMTIKNKKDNETYTKDFNSVDEAKQWVINHLDLSKNWEIKTKNERENKMKYNNIQDVSTSNLYKMLSLKQFQDDESQKMIKDEIKFRNEPITMNQLTSIFKMGIVQNCK